MGAMGSDAAAMELMRQLRIGSILNFGEYYGVGSPLKDAKRLSINFGDIPILEACQGASIGGILGIDTIIQCDMVCITFHTNWQIQFLLIGKEPLAS